MLLGKETKTETKTKTTRPDTIDNSIDTTDDSTDMTDNSTYTDTTVIDMSKYVSRQRDALRGVASSMPVTLRNIFAMLQTSNEDSDDDEDASDHERGFRKTFGARAKRRTTRRRRWSSNGEVPSQHVLVGDTTKMHDWECTNAEHNHDDHDHDTEAKTEDTLKQWMRRTRVRFETPLACSMPTTQMHYTTTHNTTARNAHASTTIMPTTTLVFIQLSVPGRQNLHCLLRVDHHPWGFLLIIIPGTAAN